MWRYVLHNLYRCKTNGQIKITLFVGFGFSDDRGLVVLIVLIVLVVLVIFVTIVVGVSRRQRVVNDGDEAPVDQPGGNVFNGRRHVGSCRMSRHSRTNVSSRNRKRERGPGSAQSRDEPRPGMNFAGGAPRRGSDIPRGILGLGGGITPEGACTLRPSSTRGKQTALNSSVTMTDPRCLPWALHRRAGAARPSGRARVGAARRVTSCPCSATIRCFAIFPRRSSSILAPT